MRPSGSYGEVRQALLSAALELRAERGHFTRVEVVQRAKVGEDLGRRTLARMVEAGELQRVGKAKPEGKQRWVTLYEAASPDDPAVLDGGTPKPWGGIEELVSVVFVWPRD